MTESKQATAKKYLLKVTAGGATYTLEVAADNRASAILNAMALALSRPNWPEQIKHLSKVVIAGERPC